jgi:hypothetical protein
MQEVVTVGLVVAAVVYLGVKFAAGIRGRAGGCGASGRCPAARQTLRSCGKRCRSRAALHVRERIIGGRSTSPAATTGSHSSASRTTRNPMKAMRTPGSHR